MMVLLSVLPESSSIVEEFRHPGTHLSISAPPVVAPPTSSTKMMASTGQLRAQVPHSMQMSGSM
jgi:hypothetical protein